MHSRLRRERGRAAECDCVECADRALDWAQIHGTTGRDIWRDYQPMCRKCHMAYDYDARWSPEDRAARAARRRALSLEGRRGARSFTDADRAKAVAATRRRWSDPAEREKLAERNRQRYRQTMRVREEDGIIGPLGRGYRTPTIGQEACDTGVEVGFQGLARSCPAGDGPPGRDRRQAGSTTASRVSGA